MCISLLHHTRHCGFTINKHCSLQNGMKEQKLSMRRYWLLSCVLQLCLLMWFSPCRALITHLGKKQRSFCVNIVPVELHWHYVCRAELQLTGELQHGFLGLWYAAGPSLHPHFQWWGFLCEESRGHLPAGETSDNDFLEVMCLTVTWTSVLCSSARRQQWFRKWNVELQKLFYW